MVFQFLKRNRSHPIIDVEAGEQGAYENDAYHGPPSTSSSVMELNRVGSSSSRKNLLCVKNHASNDGFVKRHSETFNFETEKAIHGISQQYMDVFEAMTTQAQEAKNLQNSLSLQHKNSIHRGSSSTSRRFVRKPNRWHYIRTHKKEIIALGVKEGITPRHHHHSQQNLRTHDGSVTASAHNVNAPDDPGNHQYPEHILDSKGSSKEAVLILPTHRHHDNSKIHAAIPYLPVPAALFCCFLNVVLPGFGTMLSGFLVLCMGQPRMYSKHSKVAQTVIINTLVGIAQLGTITFMMVGWFWSITWGGLMIIHSFEYKQAVDDSRKEAVTTVAIEALTKQHVLHRKRVTKLIKDAREEAERGDNNEETSNA